MDLSEKLSAALDGEDLDDVIPALTIVLAQAGAMACNDREVFTEYVMSVIDKTYDCIDEQNNSLQ